MRCPDRRERSARSIGLPGRGLLEDHRILVARDFMVGVEHGEGANAVGLLIRHWSGRGLDAGEMVGARIDVGGRRTRLVTEVALEEGVKVAAGSV